MIKIPFHFRFTCFSCSFYFPFIVPASDMHTLGMTVPSNLGSKSSLLEMRAFLGFPMSFVLSLFVSSFGFRFPHVIPSGFAWDGKNRSWLVSYISVSDF